MFRHLLVVTALLLLPVAALAQGGNSDSALLPPQQEKSPGQTQPPDHSPHAVAPDMSAIPENILKGEGAYATAFAKLTDEQKSDQQSLDQGFYVTMVPTMETYDMGGKLIFCFGHEYPGSAISANQKKYMGYFKAFQAQKDLEQKELWQKQQVVAARAGYIDHALMEGHYDYIEAVQKAVAEQMVDRATRTDVYRQTDCVAIQNALKTAADGMQKGTGALKVPPGVSKDGTNGTLGDPKK